MLSQSPPGVRTLSSIPSVLPVPRGVTDLLHSEDAEFRERAAAATMVDVASPIPTLSFMAAGALAEIHRVFNRCDMMKMDPSKKIAKEILIARGRKIALHGLGREGLMIRAFTMRLFHLGLQVSCVGDMTCPKLGPGDLFIATAGPGKLSSASAIMITAKEAGAKVLLVTAQPHGDAAKTADEVAWLPAQTMNDDDPESPQPLPESCPLMVDRKAKEDAKAKAKKHPEDISAGKGPKDSSKMIKEKQETAKRDKEEREPKSPKSPKSPTSKNGSQEEPRGELGVGVLPDPENICLLANNKVLPMGSVYEGALFVLFEVVTYILRVKLDETPEGMRGRHTNME